MTWPVLLVLLRAWWKALAGAALGAALAFPLGHFLGQREGHRAGVRSEQAAEAKRLEAARKVVVKREAVADKITADTAGKLTEARVRIEYRTKLLTQEVKVYVPQAADDRCVVPVGLVLLHDRAASGGEATLSKPPGGLEQASGIALSDAFGAVVGNYGTALGWRAEAEAWRSWYAEQSAAWKKVP